ncbi:MAG: type II secretion system F family protein [Candidatus Stahlbacteria bacterium]|nr:type II secretion system F family protein [Candidatus Stahlbacteria bacterium]
MDIKHKFKPRIPAKEVMVFTRQFAVMIKAGVPIVRGLEILSEQAQNKGFHKIILQVTKDVETGSNLTDALARHKDIFDNLYLSMVKAGEAGGVLDTTLTRVAEHLEKTERLKGKIKSALAYPAVIFIVAIAACFFILTFIMPTFAQLFAGFGAELPALTRIVMGLSYFIRHNMILLFVGTIGLIFAFRAYAHTPQGRHKLDAIQLKLPVFGDLLKKTAIARFSRTLSTLTASGVPILTGLEITATTSGNKIIEESVLKAKESISGGKSIFEPLRESKVFPLLVTDLIRVGEESGSMGEMLEKIADFYEDEVDTAITTLTSLIEPITIVFLGGMIGVLIGAMYLPMFQLASVVK